MCNSSSNNNNNPHSTTSPNLSPANVSLTNSSQLTPPHTDENDNNLNDFENDNISVTGSPLQANSTEDDEKGSPSPFQSSQSQIQPAQIGGTHSPGSSGAFTSLRPTATAHPLHSQLPQQSHALNHALAAQLFLQSPLMPHPSQWLYSQLYGGNYNELPWFRTSIQSAHNNGIRLLTG